MKVDWLDENGQFLPIASQISGQVTSLIDGNSGGWVKKGGTITVPAGAFMGRVVFFHGVNSQTQQNCPGSTLWVDDVTFQPNQSSQLTLTPNTAVANAGDVPVTISGLNFQTPLNVTLGSVALLTPTLENSTTLHAVVPVDRLAEGVYTLTVTSAGQTFNLAQAFTVTAAVAKTQFRMQVILACDGNLEGECMMLFNELEKAMLTAPDLRIIVLWDGRQAGDSAYYLVQPDANPYMWANYAEGVNKFPLGEVNTASPSTLVNFANWSASRYPGVYKLLELVGHGEGWAHPVYPAEWRPHGAPGGMLWDEHPGDGRTLSTVGLADALKWVTLATPFEVLYLNACLMGNVEVISELAPHAQIIVSYENLSWATYSDSQYLTRVNSQTSPIDLATWIAQVSAKSWPTGHPAEVAVIRTSGMPAVQAKLDALFAQLLTVLPTQRQIISETVRSTMHLEENGNYYLDDKDSTIDLHDLASQLMARPELSVEIKNAARDLQQAIATAVLVNYTRNDYAYASYGSGQLQWWQLDRLHGLSGYFPVFDDWRRPFYNGSSLPNFATTAPHAIEFIQAWNTGTAPAVDQTCAVGEDCPRIPLSTLSLTFNLPPFVPTNNLIWVPVMLNNSTDESGIVFKAKSSDVNLLKPACDQTPRNGQDNFLPTTSLTRYVCNGDSWDGFITLPAPAVLSGTGTLVKLPFYTQGAGEAYLSFAEHQLANGQASYVSHQAIPAWTEISTNPIMGNVALESRLPGHYTNTLVTFFNGTTTVSTTTNSNGDFVLPPLASGSYTVTATSKRGFVKAKRVVAVENGLTPLNICLWAGDVDGDNDVDKMDWLILTAAILPVGDPTFNLNDDGLTDVLDLVILSRNIGRANMMTTDCPSTSARRGTRQDIQPVPTQATLTLTVQAANQLGLSVAKVREPVVSIGTRLKLPVGMVITSVALQNEFAGGFLSWHQDDDKLYIIATTPENTALTRDSQVSLILLTNGASQQVTMEAMNVVAAPLVSYAVYLPIVVK